MISCQSLFLWTQTHNNTNRLFTLEKRSCQLYILEDKSILYFKIRSRCSKQLPNKVTTYDSYSLYVLRMMQIHCFILKTTLLELQCFQWMIFIDWTFLLVSRLSFTSYQIIPISNFLYIDS